MLKTARKTVRIKVEELVSHLVQEGVNLAVDAELLVDDGALSHARTKVAAFKVFEVHLDAVLLSEGWELVQEICIVRSIPFPLAPPGG